MSGPHSAHPQKPDAISVGARWLTPENAVIFEGEFSMIHCTVNGDKPHYGVYAMRMFPVRYPNRYISLRDLDADGKDVEVGVIERLADFPDDQRQLVRANLARYYHEQIISRVHRVECDYGLLFFDVETQRGREQFVMPWRSDSTEDYGEKGKVLLECLGNRYIIPDISELPVADQRRFTEFIYW